MMLHSKTKLRATPAKHVIYLIASTILGIFLSYFAHAVIETGYLKWARKTDYVVGWYGYCTLHPVLQLGLVIIGALGGIFLGRYWWRKLYIEQVWRSK